MLCRIDRNILTETTRHDNTNTLRPLKEKWIFKKINLKETLETPLPGMSILIIIYQTRTVREITTPHIWRFISIYSP